MPGLTLSRWVFSWLSHWFPPRKPARRWPVACHDKPTLTSLEDRFSPTSVGIAPPPEFAPPPHIAQVDRDMPSTTDEMRKTYERLQATKDGELIRLISLPPRQTDGYFVSPPPMPPVSLALFQQSQSSPNAEALDTLSRDLAAPRPPTLTNPPRKQGMDAPNPQALAGAGGRGAGGPSTANAGGGGSGGGSSGSGPGVTNANQFASANLNTLGSILAPAVAATPAAPPAAASQPAAFANPPTPTATAFPTPARTNAAAPMGSLLSLTFAQGQPGDPLYVLDRNTGETVSANATLNTFSTWSENLLAQVAGATVSNYSWDLSRAPDLTNVSGQTTANLQGTWANFTGAARTNIITVTETPTLGAPLSQTLTFQVAGTNSPAYSASRPTSSGTWPSVATPDRVTAGQAAVAGGPYASLGLADGSVQTSFSMPSYNPNVAPASLAYNSTTATAQPIFLAEYQLPVGQAVPATITAQLTLNGTAGPLVYYNTSGLNPGDIVQIALQGNATSLSTGRYPWQISVTNGGTPTNYSGNVDLVNQASSPFGAGWSLDNVEQLVSVSGGVMLVQPGGTSLWFASNGSGGFIAPAGDFSTLVQNQNGSYTRTLTDGTAINFNSSGQQTSVVDRDGNTTTFGYTSGQLTTITDLNGQVTTLTYTGGKLTSIADPASRSATLAYTGTQLTSITDAVNDVWGYAYDSSNRLTTLTDPRLNATTFTYNFAGRVASVTRADNTTEQLTAEQMNGLAAPGTGTSSNPAAAVLLAAGDQARFTDPNNQVWLTNLDWLGFGLPVLAADPLGDTSLLYRDANGLPWMSADPLARRTREFFDNKGNPTEIVQPDDSFAQYQYNNFGEVTQATDPTGAITSYAYNAKGDLTQLTDALLHPTTYAYNTAGLLTSTTDPLGRITSYTYNALNELTGVTNALNQSTTYAYNTAGLITSTTDARGFTSTFAYDALNRLTGKTLADSGTTNSVYAYSYDSVGNQISATDPLNHITSYSYDKLNRLSGVTDALNEATTYGYDAAGNLTGLTNPLNQMTSFGYDAADRLTSITNALNQATTFGYDAAGQKTSITNALNQTTTYGYTVRGQVASITDPLGDVLSYSYNAVGDGLTVSQTGPGQHTFTTTMAYNALHQLTSSTDPLNNTTTYGYDAIGNQTSVTDPLGHATTYAYNALNQLTGVTDALNHQTTFGYDADGNQISITDPLLRVTTMSYDAQGRLLAKTDPLVGTTSYAYNLAGLLTSLTDAVGNQTTYGYDAVNRLTSTTDPLLHSTTYAYNAAGEMTSETDRDGRVRDFGYDAAGRETSETWVGGSYTATYAYNAAGELTNASDPFSVYNYGYNAAAQLTSVDNQGTPGVPHVLLTYGYDVFGNRISMHDSLGGLLSYSYDGDHRLSNITMAGLGPPAIIGLTYDAAGRLASVNRSGGGDNFSTSFSYDNANRLTNIAHTDTTKALTLASYTYGYDAASQLTSYQDSNSSLTYGYDAGGQLTSAAGTLNGSSYAVSYSYDKNGNRTMAGYATGASNRLTSDGAYNYTYDNEGNTLTQTQISTGSVTYYTWDFRNRLTEVQVKDSHGNLLNDEKFTYDVNNNRIGTSLNGVQQLYTVYDGANPYMDFTGSGTLTERYLTNPNGLSQFYGQVNASGATQWFLTDNIGSIRQVVSTSGTSLDALTYDSYGQLVNQTNAANAPRLGYTGGAVDSVTGNVQDDARYYRPADGKFLSEDPLGFKAYDTDLYRYSFNEPVSLNDPSGEIIGIVAIGIGIYLAGALTYKYSKWSMRNQQSGWAVSTTYARCGMAGGKIAMATGASIAGGAFLAPVASAYPVVGVGMLGFGTGATAKGAYNIYQADHTGWGAPEYTGEIGSLAAPWLVGGAWWGGTRMGWVGSPRPRLPVGGSAPSSGITRTPSPIEIPPPLPERLPGAPRTMRQGGSGANWWLEMLIQYGINMDEIPLPSSELVPPPPPEGPPPPWWWDLNWD